MPNDVPRSPPACPMCGKPRVAEFAPFCSRGCRDRDLLRWFGEDYRLPVVGEPPASDGHDEG